MDALAQQIVNGISLGTTYAVVALGFGLIFSVMRVINMAHPSLFMVGAYATAVSASHLIAAGYPSAVVVVVSLCVSLLVAAAIGLAAERLVIRPLRGRHILIPFIATGGVAIVLDNLAQRLFGVDPIRVPSVLPMTVYTVAGVRITSVQLLVLAVAVIVLAVVTFYVRGTRWGLATRAVAERPVTAAAFGANVNRVFQLTVGLSAATAGLAGGAVGLLLTQASPHMGVVFGMKSFICMLVAGNKRIEEIMAVGILLGVIESLVAGYVSTHYRDAIAFTLLLVVLVFRPRGLFGSYDH